MRRYSDPSLFVLALCLSLVVHAGAAWYWADGVETREGRPLRGNIQLVVQVEQPAPRQDEAPAPEVAEPVRPVEPPPRPRAVPERSARVSVPPQPVAERPPEVQVPPAAAVVPRLPLKVEPQPVIINQQALAETYRARLMRHIEGHKYYPMAARRRHVQGGVKVRLRLACDGGVLLQEMDEGALLLRHAAQRAVELAQPLPAPPAELPCPQTIQYVMRYELLER